MHILYYHLYFNTRNDTSGTRSYEFAKRLLKRGHRVTMVCGSRDNKVFFDGEVRNGYKHGNIEGMDIIEIQLPNFNYYNFVSRALSFIRYGIRGIKLALKMDYDLLFATSTPLTASIPGIVMKFFRKKPFVFEVRDLWPELPRAMGVIKNPLALRGMSILEWLSYRKADACIGLAPGIVEGIRRRSKNSLPVAMIPNASDLDLFICRSEKNLSLDGIAPGDTVAVFTGAHGIANGLDAVLDTAECLIKMERFDIKILFIGKGQKKSELIERAGRLGLSNCIFMDPIPKNKLADLLSHVDIGLMILANVPAFYYGTSPNKFFDYLASGLPILNNYPGWIADMITEHQCGVAVEPDNPVAFAKALIRLADNPIERQKMGVNARKLAESQFDRNRLSAEFVDVLEKTRNIFLSSDKPFAENDTKETPT